MLVPLTRGLMSQSKQKAAHATQHFSLSARLSIMCLHICRVSDKAVIGSLQPCHLEGCCLFLRAWWSTEKKKHDLHLAGRGQVLTMHYPLLAEIRVSRERATEGERGYQHIFIRENDSYVKHWE